MQIMMQIIIGFAFIGVVFLLVYWASQYLVSKRERLERTKPIVCVCEEQGRVGVVLRKDYDAVSKAEWQPYIDGTKQHDPGHVSAPFGRRLQLEPVFVFKSGSPEYFTLMYYCFVECAEFYVPHLRDNQMNDISSAWQYIFGKQFTGQLINW